MQHQELARHLSVNPTEIVYTVTMETVLSAIVKRMGKGALSLTVEEIELARDEMNAAIDHNLDIRDYLEGGGEMVFGSNKKGRNRSSLNARQIAPTSGISR